MIIMPVKEGENIERALKKFKRKYERTGVLKELRRRQYFTKPSIAKREAMQHAIYVEHMNRLHQIKTGNIFERCSRFSFDLAGSIPPPDTGGGPSATA